MEEIKKTKYLKIFFLTLFVGVFFLGLFKNIGSKPGEITVDKNKINLYFFYGQGCPHCAKEEKFLDKLEEENRDLRINRFETWYNKENADLLEEIAIKLNLTINGVPVLIIGEEAIVGYGNDETTGTKIKNRIDKVRQGGCEDPVLSVIKNTDAGERCTEECNLTGACEDNCGCEDQRVPEKTVNGSGTGKIPLPFWGEVDLKKLSLPAFTLLIAATDGFNPCAMWVLLFLISLLLGMENRKKMWILGSAFIITSGLVYFLFLSAWLNLFLFLGFVAWIRLLIGLVAFASGEYHLFEAYQNRGGGCHVIKTEKRKKVFDKLRSLVSRKNFFLAVAGIVSLAVAVNLVELVCSAGLPAVYTQVLSVAKLPWWQYYGYLLLYIVTFMLDDMLVFVGAMVTLRMSALSSRYTAWAQWVGGIVMFIIGILLLFKPEWIMFA